MDKDTTYFFSATLWVAALFICSFCFISLPQRSRGYAELPAPIVSICADSQYVKDIASIHDSSSLYLTDPLRSVVFKNKIQAYHNPLEDPEVQPLAWDLTVLDHRCISEFKAPQMSDLIASPKPADLLKLHQALPHSPQTNPKNSTTLKITQLSSAKDQMTQISSIPNKQLKSNTPPAFLFLKYESFTLAPPLVINRLPEDTLQSSLDKSVTEVFHRNNKEDGYYQVEITQF